MGLRPAYLPHEIEHLKARIREGHPVEVFGVDPDLHAISIAKLEVLDTIRLQSLDVVRVPADVLAKEAATWACSSMPLTSFSSLSPALLCVESQHVRLGGTARPEDLILLAEVVGAVKRSFFLASASSGSWAISPLPQHWKGGLDKVQSQTRTWRKLGYPERDIRGGKDSYVVPRGTGCTFKTTDWKHLGDAAGLAHWAAEELLKP